MNSDIERVLIDEKRLSEINKSLGERISRDYEGKRLLVVCVIKGSLIFTADLLRRISVPCELEFIQASSYGSGAVSSGRVEIKRDIPYPIDEYDILIVEDIIDSGRTLRSVIDHLEERNAKSVSVCTLLSKPSRREVDVDVKYIGEEVPDLFVVGYGLDYAERYRSLPYVGVLKPQVYENKEV